MAKIIVEQTRKSVAMPDALWNEIADFRFSERVVSEAEALRRIVMLGLAAWKDGAKPRGRKAK